MVTVECPWCDELVRLDMMADDLVVRCDECDVAVEAAPDSHILREPLAAAA
jgi:endogenous inhibitor of DNA gyrase (YacG/DUF329 family)